MDFPDTHGKECNATNIKYCNFFPAAGTIKWQLKVKKDQLRPPIMPHSMSWREGDIDILYMQRLIYIYSVECTKRMLDVVSMFLFHWLQCFTIIPHSMSWREGDILFGQSDKILFSILKYCKNDRSLIWYDWVFQIFHPRCNRLSCARKSFNTCNIVDGLFFINCCLLKDVITNISIHRRLFKLGYCKIWRRWFHKHIDRECQICKM